MTELRITTSHGFPRLTGHDFEGFVSLRSELIGRHRWTRGENQISSVQTLRRTGLPWRAICKTGATPHLSHVFSPGNSWCSEELSSPRTHGTSPNTPQPIVAHGPMVNTGHFLLLSAQPSRVFVMATPPTKPWEVMTPLHWTRGRCLGAMTLRAPVAEKPCTSTSASVRTLDPSSGPNVRSPSTAG